MYSILYQEQVPPNGGGDTMFSSAYKAYEELSPGMKIYRKRCRDHTTTRISARSL